MNLRKYPRLGGFILFLIGMGTSLWYYNSIVNTAISHTQKTIGESYGLMALVSFSFLGIWIMILGEKIQAYSKGLRNRKKTTKDFIIIGLLVLPGIITFFLLKSRLAELGYYS